MSRPLRIGSLCSGYGGLTMAAHTVLGGRAAWYAQYDPADKHQYAARIMAHHHPGIPNHGDITTADWDGVEPVDVLEAGFPCQPVSNAGKKKGADDDRWLWPDVARAVRQLRPRLVVLENVAALLGRGMHAVLGDLAALGFDAQWITLRASDVGAAHQRARVFILAWPVPDASDDGLARGWRARPGRHGSADRGHTPADADGERLARWPEQDGEPFGPGLEAPRRHDPDGRDQAASFDWSGTPYAGAVRRWERVLERRAPAPVDGNGRLAPVFAEWLMGLPAGHVTDVPGLPRSAQLKALGNGVVPQQGAAALRMLLAGAGA